MCEVVGSHLGAVGGVGYSCMDSAVATVFGVGGDGEYGCGGPRAFANQRALGRVSRQAGRSDASDGDEGALRWKRRRRWRWVDVAQYVADGTPAGSRV